MCNGAEENQTHCCDLYGLMQACHLDILMKTQGEKNYNSRAKNLKLKIKKLKTQGFSQNIQNTAIFPDNCQKLKKKC